MLAKPLISSARQKLTICSNNNGAEVSVAVYLSPKSFGVTNVYAELKNPRLSEFQISGIAKQTIVYR